MGKSKKTSQWSDKRANPLKDIKQAIENVLSQESFLLQHNRGIEQLKRAEATVKKYYPENKQDQWGQQNPDPKEDIKE